MATDNSESEGDLSFPKSRRNEIADLIKVGSNIAHVDLDILSEGFASRGVYDLKALEKLAEKYDIEFATARDLANFYAFSVSGAKVEGFRKAASDLLEAGLVTQEEIDKYADLIALGEKENVVKFDEESRQLDNEISNTIGDSLHQISTKVIWVSNKPGALPRPFVVLEFMVLDDTIESLKHFRMIMPRHGVEQLISQLESIVESIDSESTVQDV